MFSLLINIQYLNKTLKYKLHKLVNFKLKIYNTLISLFNELVNNEIPEKINVVSKSKESLPKNE